MHVARQIILRLLIVLWMQFCHRQLFILAAQVCWQSLTVSRAANCLRKQRRADARRHLIFWVQMMAHWISSLRSFHISIISCHRLKKRSRFPALITLKVLGSVSSNVASSTASSPLVAMAYASWMSLERFCVSQHSRSKSSTQPVAAMRSMQVLSQHCTTKWM
ncbi:hypothetical protein FQZ97_1071900 [compost metagenome]